MARKRTSLYRVAEVLALIAGILGIVFAILSLLDKAIGESWIWEGGFGVDFAGRLIVSVVCSVLVLLVGLGSLFIGVRGLVIGIVVIILSLFIPGVAELLGIVSGILFIIEDVA
ncbi:MAG: hypothetical protein KAR08_02800 [Candidatus Heimdallarchaeota archaeon]|nr:hypothetical protein [Candidatus Heimdallarchaeota archaeon]